MKSLYGYFLAVCCLLAISACQKQSENFQPDTDVRGEDCVYMGMMLAFPEKPGFRSSTTTSGDDGYVTSDGGTEPGKESESTISELLLVLADSENNNVAAGLLDKMPSSGDADAHYVVAVPFRQVKELTGQTLNVYVFCNPTDEMKSIAKYTPEGVLPKDFVDRIGTLSGLEDDMAWKSGRFLMSNARFYTATMPDKWSGYRSISSPFPLLGDNKLEVERSVARFDYKTVRPDNRYPVSLDREHIGETENAGVEIQLTDAAFVNVSRNFYYLRRVASEGMDGISYCGLETKDNYVLDTDASYKMGIAGGWPSKSDYFFSNLEQPESWVWDPLAPLADAEEDNEWGNPEETGGYHIWRYLTENTAPSLESQVKSISTGIVFRGRIVPGAGCDPELADVLNTGIEPVYVYDNRLYGTWEMTGKAGDTDEELRVAWYGVETGGFSLEEMGFLEYKPVDGIYENYYYYWNIHNDNGIDDPDSPDFMAPMKYAVVRNNVYKLSVDAIFSFGLRDPSEEKDKDPLPSHIMMGVKILPWVEQSYDIIIDETKP